MSGIVIVEQFTGYPEGRKREFAVGEEPDDLDPAYARLLVEKGHARWKDQMPPAAPKRRSKP